MIDVVIPARNEEATIAAIIDKLRQHPNIGQIHVAIDPDTTDHTEFVASTLDAHIVYSLEPGKGQTVTAALKCVDTERVMFCDADIYGLTHHHITQLTSPYYNEMIIGVPDFPPFPDIVDKAVPTIIWAWPWVSGQRTMPTYIAREPQLHGYLMETQLNHANHEYRNGVRLERLEGLKSPFDMNDKRIAERERDHRYGIEHGILPPW